MENKSTTKRYPPELKERAVRMVLDLREQDPHDKTVISRVARQLEVGDESLRSRVKRADVDAGKGPGMTTEEHAELKRLRKENFERRRTTSSRQRQVSSGRSSTADTRSSHLHRRPSGPHDRWASMGGRADLRGPRGRPSTYYDAKNRPPSARAIRDAELGPKLVALWKHNYSVRSVLVGPTGPSARRRAWRARSAHRGTREFSCSRAAGSLRGRPTPRPPSWSVPATTQNVCAQKQPGPICAGPLPSRPRRAKATGTDSIAVGAATATRSPGPGACLT
jgi:transposase